MKKQVRIIVVGGNAAGPAAAAKAKRINPNADVILFEASEFISTGTCEMPYVLSGEIDDYRKIVFFSSESFMNKKGVKVFVKHLVEEIDSQKKQVTVKNLLDDQISTFSYDTLILTTGSKARMLPVFDKQVKNIFTFKSVNDLIRINKYLSEGKVKNALVIGSGYIGLEVVESLIKRNVKVKVVEKESRPLPAEDKRFGDEILKLFHDYNVEFIGDVKETEPVLSDEKLLAVKVDENIIETDLVLVSVGFEPDNFLARLAKIDLGKSGGIKIDQYAKTSNRFIYAAGDNVEVLNAVTGKQDYIPLATHAYNLGHTAGENAAGGNVKYDPFVKNISVKIFDKYFASVGLSKLEAKSNGFDVKIISVKARNLVAVMPRSDFVLGNLLVDKNKNKILGASFWGGSEVSGYADIISSLIKLNAPANMLSKINYNYTPPLSPFINLLSIIGKQVK
ncbi:MAG: FAD-dependent oxidoreductase [Ignavibacteriaceae bacterium]|nr:FAD-dependent oxidoreductase [Ignavibacteria bacterium]MBT8392164.1 FAD-dependent oxidoreductase [Ignavibacteria bacterium]NNL20745.1 FAD-dependent oxidoreductase [Ignavibacteriaceae bacterium]